MAMAALLIAGCTSSAAGPPGSVSVVASTNVWGDVARDLAGRLSASKVQISSIISDAAVDPHSYEASARDELAIKRADLVIENGGGYDDFMDQLRDASGTGADVINAFDIGAPGSDNEHVWYDFPTVAKVAVRVEAFLIAHDRAHATTYRANARAFTGKLRALEAEESRIKADSAGAGVAITEPVPLYMLSACGLVNRTPSGFSQAVEDGTDVPPRILQQTLDLFTAHQVKALVYNAQTGGAATDQVVSAAEAAGVPVVPVTETLPSGKTYLAWMRANLGAVAAALGSTP